MTRVIEAALAQIAKLPSDEQDVLASLLLDEIDSEQKWARTLSGSRDMLRSLADEARAEHRSGKTKPLDESL